MRTLPPDLTTELEKDYSCIKQLVLMSFTSGAVRLTDADLKIYYDGEWWNSRGLRLDPAQYSTSPKVDSISFEVDNIDKTLSNIVLSEETRGKGCTVYRVALDNNLHVIGGAVASFIGFLDAIEFDGRKARFDVFNHFIRWEMKSPRRIHQALCGWTYGGTRCGESGSTWCDHSWTRCVALSNNTNFGGFRWISALKDKDIWWGRAPGQSIASILAPH